MAKKTFAKSCNRQFDPASPDGCAVTRAVDKACHAEASSEGGKTLPFADPNKAALTVLRIFEIASRV